jgi:hypothetical protein
LIFARANPLEQPFVPNFDIWLNTANPCLVKSLPAFIIVSRHLDRGRYPYLEFFSQGIQTGYVKFQFGLASIFFKNRAAGYI